MKKTFKRAGVAVLSMAMLLSMGAMTAMTTSAYTGDNGGLTVTSTATSIKAYKVAEFTGGSWAWVTGITNVTPADMTTVKGSTDNAAELKTIANKLAADSGKGSGTTITAGTEAELAPGYYLLISSGAGKVYQNKLVEVKKGVGKTITDDKATPVTINKTITGVSANGGAVISGSSDKKASVADNATVTYQIVTDVPAYSDQATVSTMHDYVITDTYDANLKNIAISSVVIGSDTLTQAASGRNTYAYGTGTNSFTVTVDKATVLAHPNSTVTVTFTAKFDAPATPNAGYEYNNDAQLVYDNTFNATGGEDTLTSDADVYSVPIKIYKTDGTNAITSADGQFKISGGGIEQTVTLDATGYAKFDSLPAGTYTITEETAPAGYKKIEGTAATVTIAVSDEGVVTVTGATLDNTDKYYSTTITNTPQEALPGTGGMGTILFTVGGAAVVLLAGALFVVYMRRRKVEE